MHKRWQLSVDHLHPASLGGSNELHNLRAAHFGCNASRGRKLLSRAVVVDQLDWFLS